ncbi:amino acid permease-domain-containing protein, partial [Cladochytrium replicatum]
DERIKRRISWFEAGLFNVGQIIGTGIFVNPTLILNYAGSTGASLILWFGAAFIAAAGLWSFTELGTIKLLSFLFAVNGIIIARGAGIANSLIVFGNYINYAIYGPTGGLQAEIPGLVKNITFENSASDPGSYALAIYYVMFAYGGWANVNYILDEVHDPIRNLPKAATLGLGSTTILYLLANLSYFSVLTKAEINASNLTIAANFFTKAIGGTFGTRVLPALIAFSPFGFSSSILYTGSRVILETSREGLLPFSKFFNHVDKRTNSPIAAILGLYILVLVFLFAPPPGSVFSFIVTFAGYSGTAFALLAVVGVFVIRRREPDIYRPVRVPLLVFAFYPPKSASSAYPYYVPYITSIVVVILTVGLWYYQVVVRKGPENSFNAQIVEIGRRELAREVFGSGSETNVEISVTSGSDNGESAGLKPTESKAPAGKPVDVSKAPPGKPVDAQKAATGN